jgi:hypothetical protein
MDWKSHRFLKVLENVCLQKQYEHVKNLVRLDAGLFQQTDQYSLQWFSDNSVGHLRGSNHLLPKWVGKQGS